MLSLDPFLLVLSSHALVKSPSLSFWVGSLQVLEAANRSSLSHFFSRLNNQFPHRRGVLSLHCDSLLWTCGETVENTANNSIRKQL